MENKHRHIKVNYDDYNRYCEKYGHNRLDRWNRIYTPGKNKMLRELGGFIIEEEIFDGIETKYEIFKDNENYKIKFKTNTNTEYRLDLFKEPNENIYHLGFSLYNNDVDDKYDILTDKKESLELFNRLIWILKNIVNILPNNYQFCIGITNDKRKNNIYEYMMKVIKNWERRETNQYNTGWGIFFRLN